MDGSAGGWRKGYLSSHDLVLAGPASPPHSLSLFPRRAVSLAGLAVLASLGHSGIPSLSCPPRPPPLPPAVSCPLRVSIFTDVHSPARIPSFARLSIDIALCQHLPISHAMSVSLAVFVVVVFPLFKLINEVLWWNYNKEGLYENLRCVQSSHFLLNITRSAFSQTSTYESILWRVLSCTKKKLRKEIRCSVSMHPFVFTHSWREILDLMREHIFAEQDHTTLCSLPPPDFWVSVATACGPSCF